MKNIAFIVNPVAGTKTKNRVSKLIRELLDMEHFSPTVVTIEYTGHATQLAQQFAAQGYYAVAAVGNDETVSEVASGLRNTDTALAIVPNEECNNIAKHLDISTRTNRAIEMLNSSEAIKVDYCLVNDTPYFGALTIGYGQTEDTSTSHYQLKAKGIDIDIMANKLCFANASQGFQGTHKISMQDGWIDILLHHKAATKSIIEPELQVSQTPLDNSDSMYISILRTKEILLWRESDTTPIYIDGTKTSMPQELHIKLIEDGLKVLVKKRF